MDLGLQGARALVTGGTAGIGFATAERLVREGAHVVVCGRDEARLAAAERALLTAADGDGQRVVAGVRADVTDAAASLALVDEAVRRMGGLDVLVLNAGEARVTTFETLGDDDWRRAWEVNVVATARLARAALPHLRRAGARGRVVTVSSTAGKQPSNTFLEYSAAKAALLALTKGLSDLLAPAGVTVNSVCPAPTDTPLWMGPGGLADQLAAKRGVPREQLLREYVAKRPIARFIRPEEVADAVAWLCSASAGTVTGTALDIDGGGRRSVG